MPARSSSDQGLGLVASVAALAAGGVAARARAGAPDRLQAAPPAEEDAEQFFALRSDGPLVTTPDGVVLHTEVDEVTGEAAAGTV